MNASSPEKPFKLKRPYLVWAMGLALVLAPPCNFVIALLQNNVSEWASLTIWGRLFSSLSAIDQVLLVALPLAGILLFFQRKTSWFFAMATLVAVALQNIAAFLQGGIEPAHAVSFLIVNVATLVLFFFFRFPYLDQRDHVFRGMAQRFSTSLDVAITGHGTRKMTNVSESGCFIQFKQSDILPLVGTPLSIQFLDVQVKGKVVHCRNFGCGIRFVQPLRLTKAQISQAVQLDPSKQKAS